MNSWILFVDLLVAFGFGAALGITSRYTVRFQGLRHMHVFNLDEIKESAQAETELQFLRQEAKRIRERVDQLPDEMKKDRDVRILHKALKAIERGGDPVKILGELPRHIAADIMRLQNTGESKLAERLKRKEQTNAKIK